MSNNCNASSAAADVLLGPDLDATRSKSDKKLYRHITLSNGLKCVLICDSLALRQRKSLMGRGRLDDDDSDEEDDDDDDDGGSDEDYEEDEDDDGLRKAATALLVNVGSYHDPPYLQGLSHFLEHMLFLGTEDYPEENAYDKFLSNCGGDDNAFTDMEHTLYHYCIPQDTEKNVWKALDMFSSFFKCPLLSESAIERELNAVESEFELNSKDDDTRLSQLMSFTCGMDGYAPIMGRKWLPMRNNDEEGRRVEEADAGGERDAKERPFHPFAKFPWGNMSSLKIEPESLGIDVMKELRNHYQSHYYAPNMRLVVMAGYDLDEIQHRVVEYFRDVPAAPRVFDCERDDHNGDSTITNLRPYQLPFHASSLATVYRIVPVRNCHLLTITWQCPSISPHWRTKPCDYLAHLLGHEASGSVLSVLKRRGWATSLSAGTGEDGMGDASTHALFSIEISLSMHGVRLWKDVIRVIFCYMGMLKFHFIEGQIDGEKRSKEGLPSWIHDELKMIADLSYQFADEGDVTDIVEEIAENMAPWTDLPDERVLDGHALLFDDEVDNDMIKRLLFDYFTPENIRVDLMSSLFGRDSDNLDGSTALKCEEEKKVDTGDNEEENTGRQSPIGDDDPIFDESIFDKESAGPALLEPRFGTKFWQEQMSEDLIQLWTAAAMPQLYPSDELAIHLPPQNTYIPTNFDLRPADDDEHPLLNCCLKVCIAVGKKKMYFPAAVTKYKIEAACHRLSLSYEDEGEKWHSLDDHESYNKFDGSDFFVESGHEGTLDNGMVKFRVTAVPRDGEGIVFNYGDSGHDEDVEDGVAFPPIPPPAPASRLPQLIHDKQSFRMWHLHDRKFRKPTADLRIQVECDGMNGSALNQACMELFCTLCADALTETCYLASVCELGSSIFPTETGFSIRVHGFDQHLLTLTKEVLTVVMSFRGRDGECDFPSTIKKERFDACYELLIRKYSNAGMDASSFSTSLRLLCLRPSLKSSFSRLKAFEGITIHRFVEVMNQLMKRLAVDSFYHGNVNREDADEAVKVISESLTRHHVGLPKKKVPAKFVIKTKITAEKQHIVVPTIDHKDPNTAVEVYFQFGKDDNSPDAVRQRVLVDLLEHIMEEPLYNQIRTKEQFGYVVSCGARWTFGVIGMSFQVVTACKSADETDIRLDDFLISFRSELQSMDEQAFMEHIVALAKNKLEGYESLEEETSSHWSEITENRYEFESYRTEVQCLKTITKDQVVRAFDEWLHPLCEDGKPAKRRRVVFQVIGSGDGASSLGRPVIEKDREGDEIDRLIDQFHHSVKHETWGRIMFDADKGQTIKCAERS